MRHILLILTLLVFAAPAALADDKQDHLWYEGGTLQKSTVAEWVKGSGENQLATAADFIASLSAIPDISKIKGLGEMEDLKRRSLQLRDCVNQSIHEQEAPPDKVVAELVLMCTILKPGR